jgi:PPM family protein phosphatase
MYVDLSSSGASDVGLVRENNEDSWLIKQEHGLFLLADGMGGHQAGEVASDAAVRAFSRFFEENKKNSAVTSSLESAKKLILQTFEQVNHHVFSLAQKQKKWKGMGTTLCVLYIYENTAILGHLGDSRIYLLRNQELQQMTTDHSQLGDLMCNEQLTEMEAKLLLKKNLLTKAVGTDLRAKASISHFPVEDKDRFFLCSDGITDMLSKNDICKILIHSATLEKAVQNCIYYANEGGGTDNITCILVDIKKST